MLKLKQLQKLSLMVTFCLSLVNITWNEQRPKWHRWSHGLLTTLRLWLRARWANCDKVACWTPQGQLKVATGAGLASWMLCSHKPHSACGPLIGDGLATVWCSLCAISYLICPPITSPSEDISRKKAGFTTNYFEQYVVSVLFLFF